MLPEGTPSATFIIKGPFIIDGLATRSFQRNPAPVSRETIPPTDDAANFFGVSWRREPSIGQIESRIWSDANVYLRAKPVRFIAYP